MDVSVLVSMDVCVNVCLLVCLVMYLDASLELKELEVEVFKVHAEQLPQAVRVHRPHQHTKRLLLWHLWGGDGWEWMKRSGGREKEKRRNMKKRTMKKETGKRKKRRGE